MLQTLAFWKNCLGNLKMLCSTVNQICILSLQVQVSLLAAPKNVFTLFVWKLEDGDKRQLFQPYFNFLC